MFRSENVPMHVVGIYVWHGKAYLPTKARFESGIFVDVDPVHVIDIDANDLSKAIKAVKNTGHSYLPDLKTREEFLARRDSMLAVSGARNWKQLARTGACYTIEWTEKQVRIDMSRLDKKGRWEYDLTKTQILPPDTPVEQIVEIILEDIKMRPEVFQ